MHITTHNERANTSNIIGFIRGTIEPDRYVILGNHYDAWVFGAVDPNSGTAVMMELSRVLMEAKRNGWQPRRTIVFCAWGSEEPGLMGSSEWVEQYVQNLGKRAVAYLNMDMSVRGNYSIKVKGVPLLYQTAYKAAKQVKVPDNSGKTLYEDWFEKFPDDNKGVPSIEAIGGGSDHVPFLCFAGVSDLDFSYVWDPKYPLSSHPLYHSAYETFSLVDQFMDPGFKYSAAMGQYWGEMTRLLADSAVLPYSVVDYATALDDNVRQLLQMYGQLFQENALSFDGLLSSAMKFSEAAISFQLRLDNVDLNNPMEIRQFNDQLMNLERAFVGIENLPDRPSLYRHVIYALSAQDSYSGINFPGLTDLLFQIEGAADAADRWEKVRQHLAVLQFIVDSAASTLKPVSEFN